MIPAELLARFAQIPITISNRILTYDVEDTMAEWEFAQSDPSEQLAKLHHFSVMKRQADGDVEFRILIKEYACGENQTMQFYAEADKQTNQQTAPYTPCGWGNSLLKALSECVKAIHRFPFEEDVSDHGSHRGQTGW